ncbi:conserved hypothetical protein [Sphingomonas sp. EC-HK361]|nr:conserved hypothetical protein [Sphingomonas sp. EC-HK361]
MNRALAIGVAAVVAAAGVGTWIATRTDSPAPRTAASSQAVPDAQPAAPAGDVVSVDSDNPVVDAGTTPMAERTAVIGWLNKRNGVSRNVPMKVGQAVRMGDTIIRLRACERTAPWEQQQLTGAFVQLDVHGIDQHWRRVFSGWLYKERPSLNVVQNAVYDVWVKSCTMKFPETGPDTEQVGVSPAPSRSSAPNAAAPDDADATAPAATATPSIPDTAEPSNAL